MNPAKSLWEELDILSFDQLLIKAASVKLCSLGCPRLDDFLG